MTRYQRWLLSIISAILLAFAGNIAVCAYAQQQKRLKATGKTENYNRPKPTKPIRPVIPSQNRYQSDKIFLENAEVLYKMQNWNDTVEKQIVSGNVKFRQGNMWMFCDSAYYYPSINSLDAFGHVRMEQADTLFVYADQLFYNGDARLAKLTNGPSEQKVRLKDPSGELLTDTLDYDVDLGIGYYGCGGLLRDEVNTLTSEFGQYNSKSKDAEFFYDVELVNHKDNFTLLSDTLYYNTATHLAQIVSPTDIYGSNDTILTSNGWYDTRLSNLEMTHRATIIHTDSLGRATTLEGDSIVYDNATRISRAYQYRDLSKLSAPTILTDTANKMILISGFGMYNDSTKEAFATEYPLLKEYSRPDTIFLRADTIFTYVRQDTVWTTQAEIDREKRRAEFMETFEYVEFPQRADSLMPPLTREEILPVMIALLDKTPDFSFNVSFTETASPEIIPVASAAETPKPEATDIDSIIPMDNMPADSIPADSTPADSIPADSTPADSIPADSIPLDSIPAYADSIPASNEWKPELAAAQTETGPTEPEKLIKEIREYHVAKAYPRGRFFSNDVQGVADTLEFYENDSLMYLKRKPAVWSGERQVTGKVIILHFNDSTVDNARLPETGFMAERVDEDYFNQLAGKKMEAWFEDEYLKRLYVEGNVQVIMLPMENDSTYNKLVDAESSHMTVDMKDRKIEKIKMWPEVTGNTTPLFLVKKAQKYLPNFTWLEAIRPRKIMIDGVMRWEDELGEISEELEMYFNQD